MSGRLLLGCVIATWFGVAPATAQVLRTADAPRRGAFEVGGGLSWAGAFDVDSLPANLTANAGNEAPPTVWFNTETHVGSIAGAQARVGMFISSSVALEARMTYSRPVVSVRIFDDLEDVADLTIAQTMSRYGFDGSIVLHSRGAASRRSTPFFLAGAGYLRELHEGNELMETGVTYHAGGGLKYWLTHGRRRLALRGEAIITVRDGGYASEERRRAHPVVSATLSYMF